jgi:hypothetical protein
MQIFGVGTRKKGLGRWGKYRRISLEEINGLILPGQA